MGFFTVHDSQYEISLPTVIDESAVRLAALTLVATSAILLHFGLLRKTFETINSKLNLIRESEGRVTTLKLRNAHQTKMLLSRSEQMAGHAAPTILFIGDGGFPSGSKLILVLGTFCSVFDLIYVWLLRSGHNSGPC